MNILSVKYLCQFKNLSLQSFVPLPFFCPSFVFFRMVNVSHIIITPNIACPPTLFIVGVTFLLIIVTGIIIILWSVIPATATSSQRAPRELPELPSMTMTMISGALIIQWKRWLDHDDEDK